MEDYKLKQYPDTNTGVWEFLKDEELFERIDSIEPDMYIHTGVLASCRQKVKGFGIHRRPPTSAGL